MRLQRPSRGRSHALCGALSREAARIGDSAFDSLGRPWEVEETVEGVRTWTWKDGKDCGGLPVRKSYEYWYLRTDSIEQMKFVRLNVYTHTKLDAH